MKPRYLIVVLTLLPFLLGINKPPSEEQMATSHFAICLTNNYQSGIVTYAIVKVYNDKIVAKKILRRDTFVQMIVGRIPNAANLERKNLFIENDLDTCVVYVDDIQGKYTGHICTPLDQLWKIKYKEHPVEHGLEEGWSQDYYSPTMNQLKFLQQEFGIWSTTQYIWGDKMWELFHKVMDPVWIDKYKTVGL